MIVLSPVFIFVPVFIISLSILLSLLVGKYLKTTTEELSKKMQEINSLNEAIFMKHLLEFFVTSEASRTVANFASKVVPSEIMSSGDFRLSVNAFQDVEELHNYMQSVLNPSVEYSKLSYMSKFLPRIIVLYGIILSATTAAFYVFSTVSSYRLMDAAIGSLFGSTLLFSPLIVFLMIDFFRHENRIRVNGAWDELSARHDRA